MIVEKRDFLEFQDLYRRTFINSLAGFRQAVLVGTKASDGLSNLAIFNSLIHLGASPALFGLITRPDTVQRDTLRNIIETKEYTLNYISAEWFKKAHQTSARYEAGISEFVAVGFEEENWSGIYPPFVKEAIVKIAMKFEEKIDIKMNGTAMIIGSIEKIELKDNLMNEDGFISLDKEDILISCGLDAYYKAEKVGRLSYAKPNKFPVEIP